MLRLCCSLFAAFCLLLTACRPSPQYQQHYTIPSYKWAGGFQPVFTFDITDTAAAYQVFFTVRHTEDYPFRNIWLLMGQQSPGDTGMHTSRVELTLAEGSGQWRGRGMGEIIEQLVPLSTPNNPTFFTRKGRYTIRLTQDMRRDPLPEVMQVGLRIEKLGMASKAVAHH